VIWQAFSWVRWHRRLRTAASGSQLRLAAGYQTPGQRCRPEEPHLAESEVRARGNSSGCPRLLCPPLIGAHGTKLRRRHRAASTIFIRQGEASASHEDS
jgi:hypothetical protein